MSWTIHRVHWLPKFQYQDGTAMVPLVSAGGAVAYELAYTRAEQLGYPRTFARPPESAVVDGWYFQFPHGAAICVSGLLPLGWLIVRLRRSRGTVRAARRRQGGLCAKCGYDLRASAGVCSECGARVADIAVGRDWPGWLCVVERFSLGLFVVASMLWVASYAFNVAHHQHKQQVIGSIFASRSSESALRRGELWWGWNSSTFPIHQPVSAANLITLEKYRGAEGLTETAWTRQPQGRLPILGFFGALSADGDPGNRRVLVGVRLMTLAILFGILPAIRLWVGAWPARKHGGDATNVSATEKGTVRPTGAP